MGAKKNNMRNAMAIRVGPIANRLRRKRLKQARKLMPFQLRKCHHRSLAPPMWVPDACGPVEVTGQFLKLVDVFSLNFPCSLRSLLSPTRSICHGISFWILEARKHALPCRLHGQSTSGEQRVAMTHTDVYRNWQGHPRRALSAMHASQRWRLPDS